MTKAEKQAVLDMPSIAYYSGFGGLEIKDIEYGINDYVVFITGAWIANKTVCKSEIKYDFNGDAYFTYRGAHVPLDECIRI